MDVWVNEWVSDGLGNLVVSKWVYEWVKSELAMTHIQEANSELLTICEYIQ